MWSDFKLKGLLFFICFFLIELEAAKKQAETDKKGIEDLVRERDILNKVCQFLCIFFKSLRHM